MSKNFLNLLATSVIILSCGTAINSSSCYCMDSDDSDINSINEQDTMHNNNKTIAQKHNNYDSSALIGVTFNLFNKSYYAFDKQEIRDYLDKIIAFYKSDNIDLLNRLTALVHEIHDNTVASMRGELHYNLNEWLLKKYIASDAAEQILRFNLLLHIMTDIEHHGELVFPNCARQYKEPVYERNQYEEIFDSKGRKYWVRTSCRQKNYGEDRLWQDISLTISSIAEFFIHKYLSSHNSETRITRDELESEIKDYIYSICNDFDSLPVVKQILNSKNIKSTYDRIPSKVMNHAIFDAMMNFTN